MFDVFKVIQQVGVTSKITLQDIDETDLSELTSSLNL